MVVSLDDYVPRERFDDNPWTSADLEVTADLVDWDVNESFEFDDPDDDPATPKVRRFTTVVVDPTMRYIRVVFRDDDGNGDFTEPISLIPPTLLATVTDVRNRLGRNLTEAQETQVEALIFAATSSILNCADKASDWTPPPDVKSLLSMLCVEVVCRSMSNPMALGAESETLGSYSHSQTFAREIPGSGLLLMPIEELLVRRAVWGVVSGSGRAESLPDTSYVRHLILHHHHRVLDETIPVE